ncbi:hypothetical protein ACGFYZ_12900 [Streptomyces sp. NPDC048330]|uniref:hypothetical protein n=1 Tax=Streptomyces sp. NPDC048330 TaxID=3365533 RepID=UPI003721B203
MTPRQRAPKGRDRDRDDRRAVLDVLLARAQRGVLSAAEAALLAQHVEEEQRLADETRQAMAGTTQALERHRAAADDAIVEAEQDRARVEEQLAEARHRIDLLHAVDAGRADGAQRIMDERDRAEAFLDRLYRAETYGDVLAILGEHRGLTPVAARAAATFAAAADSQAAVLAERDREHAVALATEQQRTERAEALLDRVRAARTWADLWAHLGMRYGYTAEQAGREARDRRTAAERAAAARAEEAAAALSRKAGELLDVRQQLTRARKHAGALTVSLARTAKHARKNEQRLDDARRRLAAECFTCGCPREQHASRLYANARARLDELLGTTRPADIADRLYAAIEQARKDPS